MTQVTIENESTDKFVSLASRYRDCVAAAHIAERMADDADTALATLDTEIAASGYTVDEVAERAYKMLENC